MHIEFIGPFTDVQAQRIRDALQHANGPSRMISGPRWTLFAEQIGSYSLYFAVDNRSGQIVRSGSVVDLTDQLTAH